MAKGVSTGGNVPHLGNFWAGTSIVVPCGVATTLIFFRHYAYGVMWWFVVSLPFLPLWWQVVYALHAPRLRVFFKGHLMWCKVVRFQDHILSMKKVRNKVALYRGSPWIPVDPSGSPWIPVDPCGDVKRLL